MLLAADWVYQAEGITPSPGGLLPRLFTLTGKPAVSFLWHFPLDYSSHPLDGVLSYGSPDFPLGVPSGRIVYPKGVL